MSTMRLLFFVNAIILSMAFSSCIKRKEDEQVRPKQQPCMQSNSNESTVSARIGNYSWSDVSSHSFMYSSVPWIVKCAKTGDSLILGFSVRSNPNDVYYRSVWFFLVLKNYPLREFKELNKLNSTVWFLNDSNHYVLFVDKYENFSVEDTIKITSGRFTISNVYEICGVKYGQEAQQAISMNGSFSFQMSMPDKMLPTEGKFHFYMTPFDDEVNLYD